MDYDRSVAVIDNMHLVTVFPITMKITSEQAVGAKGAKTKLADARELV